MFLLIDNFDSFTFNLVQAFQQLGAAPEVIRNDRAELLDLAVSGKLTTVWNSWRVCPGKSRSSACAWATRHWATSRVLRSSAPDASCTARHPR